MFARALLVLLLVMNLSVAAWWATQGASAAPARGDAIAPGIPRLQLLSEGATATTAAAQARRCARFGPYSDAGVLAAAHERAIDFAGGQADAIATGTVPGPAPTRWRVAAPPPPDGDTAALATRLRAAGFDDLAIVAEGPEAGTIALGRFSTAEAAARRHAALADAGFDAQVHPVGGAHDWLRVPLPPGADAASLRARFAALRADAVPCAG